MILLERHTRVWHCLSKKSWFVLRRCHGWLLRNGGSFPLLKHRRRISESLDKVSLFRFCIPNANIRRFEKWLEEWSRSNKRWNYGDLGHLSSSMFCTWINIKLYILFLKKNNNNFNFYCQTAAGLFCAFSV